MAAPLPAATTTNLLLLRHLLHRPLHSTTTTTTTTFSLLLPSKPSLSLSSICSFSSSTSPQTLTLETDFHLEKQHPHFDLNGNSNGRNVTAKEKKELGSYANSLDDKLQSQQIGNGDGNGNGEGNGDGNGRNVTVLDEKRKVLELTAKEKKENSFSDKLKSQHIGNGNNNGNGNSNGDGDSNCRNVTELDEKRKVPLLTVKEKKEICSYANSLGDKLKSQQIGKSGVTDNVAFALSETLEKNELVKLKIHKSCPGEWDDIVKQVEQATGSVVVGQIGRTVILYRPSVSKLKAEEKREHRKIFALRKHKAKIAFMNQRKDQMSRQPRRARNRRLEKFES